MFADAVVYVFAFYASFIATPLSDHDPSGLLSLAQANLSQPPTDAPEPGSEPEEPTTGEKVKDFLQDVDPDSVFSWLMNWLTDWRVLAIIGVIAFLWLYRRVYWYVRARKPVRVNAQLQVYGQDYEPLTEETLARKAKSADRIVATSSTELIVGYVVVEQVEAVAIDNQRDAKSALLGLKAAAGAQGANGIINLRQERDANGRCRAYGDAVLIRKRPKAAVAEATDEDLGD